MLTAPQVRQARDRAVAMLSAAGIVILPSERRRIEIADFGLGDLEHIGLEIVVYVNTARVCAKELVLFPHQTCPEHRHPPFEGTPGKEETFRVRRGLVYLHVEGGDASPNPEAHPARAERGVYSVVREVVLRPGQQFTIPPNTKHWLQGGPDGAVISEFSTPSRDDLDVFTDPEISRVPKGDG